MKNGEFLCMENIEATFNLLLDWTICYSKDSFSLSGCLDAVFYIKFFDS